MSNTSAPAIVTFGVSRTPPQSQASAPPTANGAITVTWVATCAVGIASVTLWARTPGGAWASTGQTQTGTSGAFDYTPTTEGTYNFATVATDVVGNAEAQPTGTGDSATVYDHTPPTNVSITVTQYGAVITLTWSADASTAGLIHYDVDVSVDSGAGEWQVCVSCSHILEYTLFMDIDRELKQTLEQLLELCRQFGVRPRLIGGLAVRGFARRKRFTHDIDLVISRHDKPNLIAILKRMGFDYQDLTQFEGVKATRRIGNTAVEIHISVERLWDMSSNQTYTLSADSAEIPIDDASGLLAPAVSVQDLLILKLMPLRDRDMGDVIALLLDAPAIDARAFWANCERTGNTRHIAAQLAQLENALRSGDFRQAWADFYGEPLAPRDVLVVLDQVHSLLKAKR